MFELSYVLVNLTRVSGLFYRSKLLGIEVMSAPKGLGKYTWGTGPARAHLSKLSPTGSRAPRQLEPLTTASVG